uniref:Uncharacterized protein n=1 Tax=Arundo donax TaxID=35708 RepID=A0A0A9EF56_ARUDO
MPRIPLPALRLSDNLIHPHRHYHHTEYSNKWICHQECLMK